MGFVIKTIVFSMVVLSLSLFLVQENSLVTETGS